MAQKPKLRGEVGARALRVRSDVGKCGCVRRWLWLALLMCYARDIHRLCYRHIRVQRHRVGGFEYRDTYNTESRRILVQERHMRWEVPEGLCETTGRKNSQALHKAGGLLVILTVSALVLKPLKTARVNPFSIIGHAGHRNWAAPAVAIALFCTQRPNRPPVCSLFGSVRFV